jgi:hypothetical protein
MKRIFKFLFMVVVILFLCINSKTQGANAAGTPPANHNNCYEGHRHNANCYMNSNIWVKYQGFLYDGVRPNYRFRQDGDVFTIDSNTTFQFTSRIISESPFMDFGEFICNYLILCVPPDCAYKQINQYLASNTPVSGYTYDSRAGLYIKYNPEYDYYYNMYKAWHTYFTNNIFGGWHRNDTTDYMLVNLSDFKIYEFFGFKVGINDGSGKLYCGQVQDETPDYSSTTTWSPTHTSQGHYFVETCNICKGTISSGYKAYPAGCPSCSNPPSVSFNYINANTVLTASNQNVPIIINVQDNENDTLTCSYYLDGSATAAGTVQKSNTSSWGTVTFNNALNGSALSEGTHTIRVTVMDPLGLKNEATVSFKVDKSGPQAGLQIASTKNSLTYTVSASDHISGLAPAAYRYHTNSTVTDWLTTNSFTKIGLTSNCSYSCKAEVKDTAGNITMVDLGQIYTRAETPNVEVTTYPNNLLKIVITDNNSPNDTYHKIKVGSYYINFKSSDGGVTYYPYLDVNDAWQFLPSYGSRTIYLQGLSSNTQYNITPYVKENFNPTYALAGQTVTVVTAPATPSNLTVTESTPNNINISWSSTDGAYSYDICRELISLDGSVIATKMDQGFTNTVYNDTDIVPNQIYHYKVRANNGQGVSGEWTPVIEAKSFPAPPSQVSGVNTSVNGSSLVVNWDSVAEAIGYELEVTFDGDVWSGYTMNNEMSINIGVFNCQCSIKVRALNICDTNDSTDTTKWSNSGQWSNSIIVYTSANQPIAEPIELETITPNTVRVHWSANGNPDSVQYKVGVFKDNILVKETAYSTELVSIISGLLPEATYSFKIKACNSMQVETEWSNEVSATTMVDFPNIPTKLRATAKSDKITLTWDKIEKADSYQIMRNDTIIEDNWDGNIYVDETVTPDTEYIYKINAVNTTGESGWSQILTKKTLGNLPTAPTVSSASGSSISVTVQWNSVDGVSGYDIEVDGKVYNTGLNTSYEHNGLLPGSYHTYRVRTRNIYGKSDWSNIITIKTVPSVPNVPNDITIAATDKQISVVWAVVDGAISYDVEIDGVIYADNSSLQYLYTVQEGTLPGNEYIIRVRAVNEGGVSEWSNSYKIILVGEDQGGIPAMPIPASPNPTFTVSGASIVSIKWNACNNATIYQVESDGSIVYTGGEVSFIHAGLLEQSQHIYRVRSGNLSGYSDWSDPITVVTGISESTSPANITYYRESEQITVIAWDKVADVNDYYIEVNGVIHNDVIHDTKFNLTTTPGVQYNIRIASSIENEEGAYLDWSDEVTFRAPSLLPVAVVLDKITATADTVTISWKAVEGANGYEVDFDGVLYDAKNNLTYNMSNLTSESSHTIRLRAYNEAGAGNWCDSKTIMTSEGLPGVPVNITGEPYITEGSVTGSAIKIHWDPIDGATTYAVEDINENIYTTNNNEIVIENLIPGEKYDFRVRAITEAGAGAWSSKISFSPVVTVPENLSVEVVNGRVRITWDKVGGASLYEIAFDGKIITSTGETSIDYDLSSFYMSRSIRVRACNGTQKSEWSQEVIFHQSIPTVLKVSMDEELSIILPVDNAEVGKYKLTLTFDLNELELVDACEITPELELYSTYIDEMDTHIIIDRSEGKEIITFLLDEDSKSWTGIASSIRFRSKIDGNATITYGVTLK